MKATSRTVTVLLAAGAAAAAAVGCGGGQEIPKTAVAVVGDQAISRAHLKLASQLLGEDGAVTAAERRKALGTLIRQRWILAEAEAEGVKARVPNPDLGGRASAQAAQFWQAALHAQQLRRRLVDATIAREDGLGDEAVERYFRANHEAMAFPERRDMLIVAFPTKDEADAARVRLAKGEPWRSVWKDAVHDVPGGSDPVYALVESEAKPTLDRAVYGARVGELSQPVETVDAWYIFKLTSLTASSPADVGSARAGIEQALRARVERRVDARLRAVYQNRTRCREGFDAFECGR